MARKSLHLGQAKVEMPSTIACIAAMSNIHASGARSDVTWP
jgi:hypothetical protein